MDDEQLDGRTVSGWEDFTPSVRTPIRDGKQYLGVVLYDWSDVSFMSGGLAYPPRMVVNLRETPERPAADYLVVFEQGKAICSGLLVHPRAGGVGLRMGLLADGGVTFDGLHWCRDHSHCLAAMADAGAA